MATAKPSALVNSISGSVGGAVFRQVKGKMVIGARMKPTVKNTIATAASKVVMTAASQAWLNLSDDTRMAWAMLAMWIEKGGGSAGSRRKSGYGLFCSNLLSQIGRVTLIQASPPFEFENRPVVTPGVYSVSGALWLQSLSRNLAADERLLLGWTQPARAGLLRPSWIVSGHDEISRMSGLRIERDQAISITTSSSCPSYTGALTATGTWTVECWYKPPSAGIPAEMMLWTANDPLSSLYYAGGAWLMGPYPGFINLGSRALTPGVWNYVAVVSNDAAHTVQVYVNGTAAAAPYTWIMGAMGVSFKLGNNGSGGYIAAGTWDEIRVGSTARSAGQIATEWAGGVHQPMIAQSDTRALWNMNAAAGSTVPDVSGNGRNMSCAALAVVPGMFSRPWAPARVPAWGEPMKVRVTGRLGVGDLWLQEPTIGQTLI